MSKQEEDVLEQGSVAVETPPESAPDQNQEILAKLSELQASAKSGGNWLCWIAGLSLLNTIITLFHGSVSFVVGLGVTQIIDGAISEYGNFAAIIGLPINLLVAGIYIMLGYFACRLNKWAFITALILYSLDTLLFLLIKEIFGLAFHAFALYCIFRGLKALNLAKAIEAQLPTEEARL